jgi:hypothetical protein
MAAPGRRRVSRRQGVVIGQQFWLDLGGRGVRRAKLVAQEIVDPFRARLRLVAELRESGRSNLTRLWLARDAE